jgi:NAD(P)-dependent dehydrogenase (short-subunit alcohol dehydrogenase family)
MRRWREERVIEHGTGLVALVTGAGRGLGEATARVFQQAGFQVVALDLQAPDLATGITGCACDVSDARSVEQVVECVTSEFGRIDIAVNCAGVDHTYWLEELTVEQFDHVIGVNLRGPFLVAKYVWPVMKSQGGGHIVNIASTAAIRVWSGASAYHASKFGVMGLGRALSVEGREAGIRVTTVIPGGMRTGFFDRFVEQGIPLPDAAKLQDPFDVANAILAVVESRGNSVVQELVITPLDEPSWP